MARFDKTEPHVGTFRARLAADWLEADVAQVRAVGLDANGRVVKGAGNTGLLGVLALGMARKARHPVDPMTFGEILDVTGLTAGTTYYANAVTGALETAPPAAGANKFRVGWTVEADRLVVRCQMVQG